MTAIKKYILISGALAIVAAVAILAQGAYAAQQVLVYSQPVSPPLSYPGIMVSMGDVDKALESGPVVLEFETQECGYCKQQRPITEELQKEYAGKATFMFIDASRDRDLSNKFTVRGVPQINVIAKKADDKYVFAGEGGKLSENMADVKFIGLTEKGKLQEALSAAISSRG
jgi:thiol-disulfide isomerase/thioredoxin